MWTPTSANVNNAGAVLLAKRLEAHRLHWRKGLSFVGYADGPARSFSGRELVRIVVIEEH